jgi:hypothetical protein
MNDLDDKELENILEKTLEYLDGGKTPAEILDLFPKYEATLKEIFSAINLLKSEKEFIIPPKELLKQIIRQIPSGVTKEATLRYSYKKEVQGRPSLSGIITKIHDLMTIERKVWAPLGIIAVVALVIISFYQFGGKTLETPAPITKEAPQVPVVESQELPVALTQSPAGNIDDAVNAILAGISDDEAFFADAVKDAELVAADSQAIGDFGQSYNENEF